MAFEDKKYLDLAGLTKYDEKIKEYIGANGGNALADAKAYTDKKIGTLDSDVSDVAAAVAKVAGAVVTEKNRAEGVEGALADLSTDAKGNLVAAINEVDGHADAAQADATAALTAIGKATTESEAGSGLTKRIEDLESLAGDSSVATQIDNAIKELDATVGSKTVAEGKHVAVEVVEEDGVLTGVTVTESDIASAQALADLQAVVGISKLAENEKSIDARLDVVEGDENTPGSIAKALKDAKDYADGLDTDSSAKIAALEATHATKSVEGNTVMMTVDEEADAAVAKIVADADEAFDTLKEIADWIQNPEGGTAFDAAKRIVALETKTASLAVADGKDVTVANAIEKAVADEASRINAVVGTPDTGKTIQAEIDDAEGRLDTIETVLNGSGEGEGHIPGLKEKVAALEELAGSDSVEKQITDALDALDSTKSSAAVDEGKGLKVTVEQKNGAIKSVSLEGDYSKTYDELGAASTAKSEVIGVSTDASSADTIYGAKKYTEEGYAAIKSIDESDILALFTKKEEAAPQA